MSAENDLLLAKVFEERGMQCRRHADALAQTVKDLHEMGRSFEHLADAHRRSAHKQKATIHPFPRRPALHVLEGGADPRPEI